MFYDIFSAILFNKLLWPNEFFGQTAKSIQLFSSWWTNRYWKTANSWLKVGLMKLERCTFGEAVELLFQLTQLGSSRLFF
jgi:hypothetical protein